MGKVISSYEGGPISDIGISDSKEIDLIYISIGYKLEATIENKIKIWACRLCSGNMIISDIYMIIAFTVEVGKKILKDTHKLEDD
jgi:hypothetical protein